MGQLIQNMQVQIKRTSQNFGLMILKAFSGFVLGLVLAIAGEEVVGYGSLSFWFIVVLFTGVFLRISRGWSLGGVLIYNLVCVLLGLLLRMYILVAPGS